MISYSSSLASSIPATSLKVAFFCCAVSRRARDLPKLSALFPPACIWRIMKIQKPTISRMGEKLMSRLTQFASFTSL